MEITDEMQAVINAAVEKATEGLKSKNKELVDREKRAKAAADEAEAARDEATQDAAAKAGDVETVKASLEKKHAAELKKLTDANAVYETRLSTLLIDNEIKTAIAENGVLPHFVPAVTAMLRAGAKMENGEAIGADGVALPDQISNFFKSNDAKHYVAAPENTGAGASGSSAKATVWAKPPEPHEMGKWANDAVANPTEFNARADGWGRPDLKV